MSLVCCCAAHAHFLTPSARRPTAMLRAVALSAILAVALVRAVSLTVPVLGGDEIPDPERTCTKSGEKCDGAAGRLPVVYKACCDDRLVCVISKGLSAELWG
jgi:hypothetical protein